MREGNSPAATLATEPVANPVAPLATDHAAEPGLSTATPAVVEPSQLATDDTGVRALNEIKGLNVEIGPDASIDAVLEELIKQHGWQSNETTRHYIQAGIEETRRQQNTTEQIQTQRTDATLLEQIMDITDPGERFTVARGLIVGEIAAIEDQLDVLRERTLSHKQAETAEQRRLRPGDVGGIRRFASATRQVAQEGLGRVAGRWNDLERAEMNCRLDLAQTESNLAGARNQRNRILRIAPNAEEYLRRLRAEEELAELNRQIMSGLQAPDVYQKAYILQNDPRNRLNRAQRAVARRLAQIETRITNAQQVIETKRLAYQRAQAQLENWRTEHLEVTESLPPQIRDLEAEQERLTRVADFLVGFQQEYLDRRELLPDELAIAERQNSEDLGVLQRMQSRLKNMKGKGAEVARREIASTINQVRNLLQEDAAQLRDLERVKRISSDPANIANPQDFPYQPEEAVARIRQFIKMLQERGEIPTARLTEREQRDLRCALAILGRSYYVLHPEVQTVIPGETAHSQAAATETTTLSLSSL